MYVSNCHSTGAFSATFGRLLFVSSHKFECKDGCDIKTG